MSLQLRLRHALGFAGLLVPLAACGSPGGGGGGVGASTQALGGAFLEAFDFVAGERVSETFIVPLEEGRGYAVGLELARHGRDPLTSVEGELRKVVLLAVDGNLAPFGQRFESDYGLANDLIDLVPVHGAGRSVALWRTVNPDLVEVFEPFASGELPAPGYSLIGFEPEGEIVHDHGLLQSSWPGRSTTGEYLFRAAGGRVLDGRELLLVAERRFEAPDSLQADLVALRVNGSAFHVEEERRLVRGAPIPNVASPPFAQLDCTQIAFGAGDGWLIAHRNGATDVRGYLIDANLRVVHRQPFKSYARARPGRSLGRFALAGSRDSITSGLYAVVVEEIQAGPPQRVTLECFVHEYRGTTGGTGNTFGVDEQSLGRGFGGPALVQNTGAHSQWTLLDNAFEPNASPLQVRRLGRSAAAYARHEVGRDGAYLPAVTYDPVRDETVYVYSDQAAGQVRIAALPRWEPRGSIAVGATGSSASIRIGPRFLSSATNVDTVLFPRVPMPGHRNYAVTAEGLPATAGSLSLEVSTHVSEVAGVRQPDLSVPVSRTLTGATRSGSSASLQLPLDGSTLRDFFEEDEPAFTDFGLVRWPNRLYAQWVWSESIASPQGSVSHRTRRSELLEVWLGL